MHCRKLEICVIGFSKKRKSLVESNVKTFVKLLILIKHYKFPRHANNLMSSKFLIHHLPINLFINLSIVLNHGILYICT